jgi:hypothetical protein
LFGSDPVWANFTPVFAIAVFTPYLLESRTAQYLFPVSVMFLSDIIIGAYSGIWMVYSAILVATFASRSIKNVHLAGITSVLFWHIYVNSVVALYGHGYGPFTVEAMIFDLKLLVSTLAYLTLFTLAFKRGERFAIA